MNNTNESLRFAGDISINKLEIIASSGYKIDITNQMIGIEVYEDIFSPFITLAITIKESIDFINALPLQGEEAILIDIGTPTIGDSDRIKGSYYIYKLSDRIQLTDRNTAYTLFCITKAALTDLNIKKSKAYSGKISDIATQLLGKDELDISKVGVIEPTSNSTKYVSNFWSPIKNLNYLTTRAMNASSVPNYLFFENRAGFNFVSLDTMYTQGVSQTFKYDNYSRDMDGTTSYRNLDRDYQRILSFEFKTPFNALKEIDSGIIASRSFSYDIVKKKYFVEDYAALDLFQRSNHLNEKSLHTAKFPAYPNSYHYSGIKHYGAHNGYPDNSDIGKQQNRHSLLGQLRSHVLEITVFGRSDYTVGQKVLVDIPKSTVITEEDQVNTDKEKGTIDSMISGYYLITAINHVINRENHTCVIELSKESSI